MTPAIREASLDDLGALRSLEQKLIEEERLFDGCIKQTETTYYDLEDLILSPQSRLIVVDSDSQVVGSGYAQLRASEACFVEEMHCYLGFLYVDRRFRGRGLVQRIIESLIEWGASNSACYVLLDVYAANEAAIRAYERYGFSALSVKMELKR